MFKFLGCVLGIYLCFLTWALLQERVTTTTYGEDKQRFRYVIFLNTVQAAVSAAIATGYLLVFGGSQRAELMRWPSPPVLRRLLQVSLTNSLASPFGYAALRYIDYPTQTLAKSCKLVPVMFMGIILYRQKFPLYKYVTVLLITAGVSGFMLLKPQNPAKAASSEAALAGVTSMERLLGLGLVLINLLIDGATNSTQDHMIKEFKLSGRQMMMYMNGFSVMLMAAYLVVISPFTNGELSGALAFCATHPAVLYDILLFSICGGLGQLIIFHVIEAYGTLLLVKITVTRKLFTIVLSVIWFKHPMAIGQWLSALVVFAGLALEAYAKTQEKKQKMSAKSKDARMMEKADLPTIMSDESEKQSRHSSRSPSPAPELYANGGLGASSALDKKLMADIGRPDSAINMADTKLRTR
ncbi:UAA-domain-containing protein [Ramicandelaber brevisporus]|nr:UAA-domain-containing protein [Ramicandelaber brevisporus]